jgi:sulfur carrier protein
MPPGWVARAAAQRAMQITVNGQVREVDGPLNMTDLLAVLQVPTHSGMAVLLNGEVVRRADWPGTAVGPEDQLEIVRATAGG